MTGGRRRKCEARLSAFPWHPHYAGAAPDFPALFVSCVVPTPARACDARRVAKVPPGVGPRFPQVVVLVGATGDLARRKLIPGLLHLARAGFIPGCRIIGVSLDNFDAGAFRDFTR